MDTRRELQRVLQEPKTQGGDDSYYLQADQDPGDREQIAAALHELRDKLTRLELAIVGIEAKEEAPVELPDSLEYRD